MEEIEKKIQEYQLMLDEKLKRLEKLEHEKKAIMEKAKAQSDFLSKELKDAMAESEKKFKALAKETLILGREIEQFKNKNS